jgi:diaminohydroxyphosphoribosylaminopyrimidine deaminase/5-amino-6-(5-phosphoribosylamino)uracil reductase
VLPWSARRPRQLVVNPEGKVDLQALLHDLARREVNELHVEAGSKLNGSLIREACIDELSSDLAPQMLGTPKAWRNGAR